MNVEEDVGMMIFTELMDIREILQSFHAWVSFAIVCLACLVILYFILRPFLNFFRF